MSTFGFVPDLLDERYLGRVRDVVGNVEPMPKLVPYDEYKQAVIVYRMDSEHDEFLFHIQEYTKRVSALLGKELWTYYVQWEVDNNSSAPMPTPKKPRLQIPHFETPAPEDQTAKRKPIIDQVNRAVIDPELIQEEEMLRVLINIVQVESSMVPNVVEWLYRWIDYLEGDGTALRAALKWEIPSLWDFDHHPLVVSGEMKRRLEEENAQLTKEKDAIKLDVQDGKGTALDKAQELMQGSPTKKMREKPSLAALEQKLEESERLKYREVRYGIRLPKDEQPLPPLFNIPLDEDKRKKYYDACYRSRHRALVLLLEAGISLQQISSYVKKQGVHPRDTPVNVNDKELIGLKHYRKDAEAGQDYFKIRATQQIRTLKQTEIAMTTELAHEGQQATRDAVVQPRSYVTDVPHAPVYVPQNDVAESLWSKIQAVKAKNVDTTNYVPTPLVGGMRSKYLELARDRREMKVLVGPDYRALGPQPDPNYVPQGTSDSGVESEESDSEADENEEEEVNENDEDDEDDDDEMNDGSSDNPMPPSTHSASIPASNYPSALPSTTPSSVQPPAISLESPTPRGPGPVQFPPFPAPVRQTHPNGPLTDERREELRHMLAIITAPTQAPAAHHASPGQASQLYSSMAPGNMKQTNHLGPSHHMSSPTNPSTLDERVGSSQAPSTSMSFQPPTLTRPALRPVAMEPQRPTVPGQHPHIQPKNSIAPPGSGPGRWTMEHFQINSRARPPPCPAPMNPPPGFAPSEVRYHSSNPQSPQVSQPPNTMTIPPVIEFAPLPGRSNVSPPVNMYSMNIPQAGLQHNHSIKFHPQQARSPLPAPDPGQSFSTNHALAFQRQQQMQSQSQAAQQYYTNTVQAQNRGPPVMQPPRLQTPLMQSHRTQPPAMQPPRLQFPGMQPPRLQFPSARNSVQNIAPTSSWPATPQDLQRPAVPAMRMNTPSLPTPPPQSNQQQPAAQASRARTMLQAATRLTIPAPIPNPTPQSNTGSIPYFPDSRAMNQITITGIQRNAPAPLTLQPSNPSPGPLTSLADSFLATTPFRSTVRGTPVQIYFPKIVVPGNGIGPGGTKLGDEYHIETDALMLGHTIPGSGEITLERALFMPFGCWTNTIKRVRAGHADVLESYPSSFAFNGLKLGEPKPCHLAAYAKLSQALSFMVSAPKAREELLTKRWRVTSGPLTQIDRGAVWEGWGVSIDRPIGMTRTEREGVMRMKWVIDDGSERVRSVEEERKWKEMEDFMEEEGEGWDFEDGDEMQE